jgi:hypothetical protein
MARIRKQKCRHCKVFFRPDPRNRNKQGYCSRPACRKASKAASQRQWLNKPENRDYFRGPTNVERVRDWRKRNPGYWRRKKPLQDHCHQNPIPKQAVTDKSPSHALQDVLSGQHPVLIGLIANLTGSALQDDIAFSLRRMEQLGMDIINPHTKGGKNHDSKSSCLRNPCPPDTRPVQLGGPPLGS